MKWVSMRHRRNIKKLSPILRYQQQLGQSKVMKLSRRMKCRSKATKRKKWMNPQVTEPESPRSVNLKKE